MDAARPGEDQIFMALGLMLEQYDKDLSEEAIIMLVADLREHPVEQILHALKRCRKELGHFPTLADIEARINPELDPREHAILIANRVGEAVAKFGWNNLESARDWLGPEAWEVVKMSSGWRNVCEQYNRHFIPQLRDLATVVLKNRKNQELTQIEGPSQAKLEDKR